MSSGIRGARSGQPLSAYQRMSHSCNKVDPWPEVIEQIGGKVHTRDLMKRLVLPSPVNKRCRSHG